MTVRLAMWSGPRNISTALMRSWENRTDTVVVDEPLYAYYLDQTRLDHPALDEVIAAGEPDWTPCDDTHAGAAHSGGVEQLTQEQSDQLFQRPTAAEQHGAGEAAAGQVGFGGHHQPAVERVFQVGAHGFRSGRMPKQGPAAGAAGF